MGFLPWQESHASLATKLKHSGHDLIHAGVERYARRNPKSDSCGCATADNIRHGWQPPRVFPQCVSTQLRLMRFRLGSEQAGEGLEVGRHPPKHVDADIQWHLETGLCSSCYTPVQHHTTPFAMFSDHLSGGALVESRSCWA